MKLYVGDVHGNLRELTRTVQRLQNKRKKAFDHIIQVGDLGLDARSRQGEMDMIRYVEDGVNRYDKHNEMPPIYFVRGNHDDLFTKKEIGVHTIADNLFQFEGLLVLGDQRFYGIGGLGRTERPKAGPTVLYNDESFNNYLETATDVLVTHQHPSYAFTSRGCDDLSTLVELNPPKLHVWGHHNEYVNLGHAIGLKKLDKICKQGAYYERTST